jgi:hypothetical protein
MSEGSSQGAGVSNFCVYVATHAGDYHYAKALCQSIRHFCGPVPIVVFKDGDFSLAQLQRLGNVTEFDPGTVPERVRGLNGTWSRIKCLFSSQYERFLYLDADTLLLNDALTLPFREYDFYVSPRPTHLDDPAGQRAIAPVYFDYRRIREYDPEFAVDERLILFNAGQFFGRTRLVDVDELLAHHAYIKATPRERSALPHADQSLLNYLLNKYHQQRRLTLGGSEFALMANLPEAVSLGRVGLDSVLEGRFDRRYVVHYIRPARRARLRSHVFGAVLAEFYRRHSRALPLRERVRDEASRAAQAARQLLQQLRRRARSVLSLPTRARSKRGA